MILNLGCGDDDYGDVRVDRYVSRTTTHVTDVEEGLPEEWSDKFDEVYSKCLLEHCKNPSFVIHEMKRVCKPNGKIVLITDNAAHWRFYHLSKLHLGGYHGRGAMDRHYCVFTKEHLRNHFQDAGLAIERMEYLSVLKDEKKLKKIDKLLALMGFHDAAWARIKVVAVKR